MLQIPEEVKSLFSRDGTKKNLRISFPNGERADITNEQIVKGSFSFSESLCSQANLTLGLCEASSVQVEVVGVENIKGYKIKVDCEIDCSSLGQTWCEENATVTEDVPFPYYSVPYGIFYVDSAAKKSGATKDRRVIKAYTREAYDDWELPRSIKSALQMGFPDPVEYTIPYDAVMLTMFPELYKGELIDTTVTSAEQMNDIHYRRVLPSGREEILNIIIRVVYKAIVPKPIEVTKVGTERYQYVTRYQAQITDEMRQGADFIVTELERLGAYGSGLQKIRELTSNIRSGNYSWTEHLTTYTAYNSDGNYSLTSQVNSKGELYDYAYRTSIMEDSLDSAFYVDEVIKCTSYNGTAKTFYRSRNEESRMTILVPYGIDLTYAPPSFISPSLENKLYEFPAVARYVYIDEFNYPNLNIAVKADSSNNADVYTLPAYMPKPFTKLMTYFPKETDKVSIKNMTEALAELEGRLGKFTRYGTFELISINSGVGLYPREDLYPKEDLYPQEPNMVLASATYSKAEWEDQYNRPFDKVSVDYTDMDGNTMYAYIPIVDMDDVYYNPDDYQSYTLGDNYFIRNQKFTESQINEILQNVADNIKGIRYMPAEVDLQGLPYIEAGDYVEFLTHDSGFQTLVLENHINGEMFVTQTIKSR